MWRTEWDALSARIAAFLEAANFLLLTGGLRQEFLGAGDLAGNGRRIVEHLRQFHEVHGKSIPESAARSLAEWKEPTSNWGGGTPAHHQVQHLAVVLASLRAEMNHLLTSVDAVGRSLVARAFQHLQRSIIADETVRASWQRAFHLGEPACEGMGACHLLSHGVWAFKASIPGERTDLVLGEPLRDIDSVRTAAEVLVLTEWKKLPDKSQLAEFCRVARTQAGLYSASILAGFELASRRYLVIVSEDRLQMPDPEQDGAVTYEYVNIAVSPRGPAQVAQAQSRRSAPLGG